MEESDSQQLYTTLMSAFCKAIPHAAYGDVRRLRVLAWAVVGVCLTGSSHYNRWGEVVLSEAQCAESHARRFARWLSNPAVPAQLWYWCVLLPILSAWPPDQPLLVALDTSELPDGFVLIRLSLVYRGRALPLTWRVLAHASASVGYHHYRRLLTQAARLLPRRGRVVLLADRGFGHSQLLRFARRAGWTWRLRLKGSTRVRLADGRQVSVQSLCPPAGHAHFHHGVGVFGLSWGPGCLAVAHPDTGEEPWYIFTPEGASETTLAEYAQRFDIEEEFRDDKSGGFQVAQSELPDAAARQRLFLVVAVATLHFTSVGAAVVQAHSRRWVDTHWERGLSYLQLGWRWLRQQFRKKWPVWPAFALDLRPDPEPAQASAPAVTQARRHWIVTTFMEY